MAAITPVVIDNGTGMIKAGFAGQELPCAVFSNVVGRPQKHLMSAAQAGIYVGDACQAKRGILNLKYPITHGIVESWEDMEMVWEYTFKEALKVQSDNQPVFMTEAPQNPKANRERMCSTMFEKLKVPALYVAIQAVLSLYSSGRTTGLCLDMGDGVTHAVPIYEGYAFSHAIQRMDMAGRDLTEYMIKLLADRGWPMQTSSEKEIVRDIKEKHCFVAFDYQAEMKRDETTTDYQIDYQLPDGHSLQFSHERFTCPEALFNPHMLGKEIPGIHEFVINSINKCDMDIRQDLAGNIVLSGGTSCFPHLEDRLMSEVQMAAPQGLQVKVVAPKNRKFSVWIGGAIMASLQEFLPNWITKAEYDEIGPSVVNRKCF